MVSRLAHFARGVRPSRRSARTANGEQRSRTPQSRRGPRRNAGSGTHLFGHQRRKLLHQSRVGGCMPPGQGQRCHSPPNGTDRRRRCPRHRHSPLRPSRSGEAAGHRPSGDSRFPRWTRHASQVSPWLHAAAARLHPEDRIAGEDRERVGPLFRDGPRSPLGSYPARV